MGSGIHWIRLRQRRLSRLLLVAFCASWLQFAVLPCTMAHAAAPLDAAAHQPAGNDAGSAPPCHEETVEADCIYCLGTAPGSCDYPQDARADLRDVAGAFAPLPGAAVQTPRPVAAVSRHMLSPDTRIRAEPGALLELYCRRQR